MNMRITHDILFRVFLGTILVVAGMIAGMRFATPQSSELSGDDTIPITVPDLSGEWIGTTTEDYGDFARYDYRVVFSQQGDELKGMLYLLRNHDREIYTETRLTGTVEDATVSYRSEEILMIENAHLDELCLVESTVTYELASGQDTLVGTWVAQENQDPACDTITGHILLTRQS